MHVGKEEVVAVVKVQSNVVVQHGVEGFKT